MSEAHEHAEHAEHAAHSNKKIALAIAIMALCLALSETLGKSANTEAINLNIKASDTWNFFQAKTIRQTALRTAAEGAALQLPLAATDEIKGAMTKQIDAWKATVARYKSDPKERDGRKELREQAEMLEHARDTALARYHSYELGVCRIPDRHRALLGGRHHQHGGIGMDRWRHRSTRRRFHRLRLIRPACAALAIGRKCRSSVAPSPTPSVPPRRSPPPSRGARSGLQPDGKCLNPSSRRHRMKRSRSRRNRNSRKVNERPPHARRCDRRCFHITTRSISSCVSRSFVRS